MLDHKTKRFAFWKARFSPEPYGGGTLQDILESSFQGTVIRDRLFPIEDLDGEERYFHFINYKTLLRGYFCANFFGYEKGRIGQILKEKFDVEEIRPSQLTLEKDEDGSEQQFLDGKLYFVCYRDNLVLAQERQLKAKHLERYLNEKLSLPPGQGLTLEPSIPRETRRNIRGVKSIRLSAPLSYGYQDRSEVSVGLAEDRGRRGFLQIPIGSAWNAVRAFVPRADLARLETRGIVSPKDIQVSIHLSWKQMRSNRLSDQLDAMANTFRRVDEEDLEMELETDVGKIKHNELRLSKSRSIRHTDDLPDDEDIFEKMIEWYEELANGGHI